MQIITEFFKSILPVRTELETGTAVSILGTVFVYMTGAFDKLIEALLVLMVVDYISGIIAVYENPNKSLDSRRGLKGIGKKIMILLLVATAHFVDYVTGQEIVRTAIIFFFIGNEGLSILENAANAGVPIPDRLKSSLEQFTKEKNEKRGN